MRADVREHAHRAPECWVVQAPTRLMQLGHLGFTIAVCSNLPRGMMYEVRTTEVKLVDYNTMRIDLLYAEREP